MGDGVLGGETRFRCSIGLSRRVDMVKGTWPHCCGIELAGTPGALVA